MLLTRAIPSRVFAFSDLRTADLVVDALYEEGRKGRDVVFRGLAVPGVEGAMEDLVAVWKSSSGLRFQNYRALFTVLNVSRISRDWLHDLHRGQPDTPNAPGAWSVWLHTGAYTALQAEPTIRFRSPQEQCNLTPNGLALINTLYTYFAEDPYAFEPCAARIIQLMDTRMVISEVTRRYRDGGRDAIGHYQMGPPGDPIAIDFALEAKCYALNHGLGVKAVARLISRLRHRQFGILLTTSFVAEQAYEEIRSDGHPVIIIAAVDITRILTEAGINTPAILLGWLETHFPRQAASSPLS